MQALIAFLGAAAAPFILINLVAGIGAGIWLALLGEWASIGLGFLLYFGGPSTISTALIPGVLVFGAAHRLGQQGNRVGFFMIAIVSALWTLLIISVWCALAILLFSSRANAHTVIPHIAWAYAVAIGPIAELAERDYQRGNSYTMISTLFAEIGTLVAVIVAASTSAGFVAYFGILVVAMLCGKCCEVAFVVHFSSSSDR